ncbi:MAG: 23S rRNA (adenine(2030)-N(6))-methyltransferase RlmJ [Pseudomonadota bacterium]
MLSYQHAYHAGNPADLHKHAALAALLDLLTRALHPITYLESHAGRGVYDLSGAEARKTGEAARGIARVDVPEGAFAEALAAVRTRFGPSAYPGSPAIARVLLRRGDAMELCEMHPAEHAALKDVMRGSGARVHRRDGHEALLAHRPKRPGLALIDPSYEVKTEYAETAVTAVRLAERWHDGIVMVWYPILSAARHFELTGAVERKMGAACLKSEVTFHEVPERGMTGSGLLILNPPDGVEELLEMAWEPFEVIF